MSFTMVFENEITGEKIAVDSDDIETFERLWDDKNWHFPQTIHGKDNTKESE